MFGQLVKSNIPVAIEHPFNEAVVKFVKLEKLKESS